LAPASAVAPFNYLSLIWASILGFAIWGDVPTVSLVIGSAVVVASGLFLFWRESNAPPPKVPASERTPGLHLAYSPSCTGIMSAIVRARRANAHGASEVHTVEHARDCVHDAALQHH